MADILLRAHPELAQDTRNFDEAYLRRISKLPPMTQLKVNFCNKLLGGKSTIIHRLGDVVNCKEVYEKYGNERKYKVKPKKKRRRPRPVRPDVSNFVEDEPIEGLDYLTKPEQEIEYFYEDIVEEEPWAPQQENFTPETETYYVTDDLVPHSPSPTAAPLHPQSNLGFQYEISHPKSSSQNANKLPITKSTVDQINPAIPGLSHSQPVKSFDQTQVFQKIPTSSLSPAIVHWEPSSYDPNPPVVSSTHKSTSAPNTYNWPSHSWVTDWPSTTPSTIKKSFSNNNNDKSISWQRNSWTTEKTTAIPARDYWPTSAPVREPTSKSVVAAPSDPTKPLGETATFSSNPWPSQFNSDVLGNVGNTHTIKKAASLPQKKRDDIMKKNYFFTPSPTPLHLRNGIDKIPSFESEFTAFGSDAHKSTFSSFDTNFDTSRFADDSRRLKKEIKSSDKTEDLDTYYHYGHHDSSAHASEGHRSDPPVKSSVLREEHKKDIVQLYIPNPLAPGHPQGNGNHGWAPIEEWAEAQMKENLDTPSWADSLIPPASSVIDWSDKTQPKTSKTVSVVNNYNSPTPAYHSPRPTPASYPSPSPSPASYHSPSPTPTAYVRSSTVNPEAVTVTQAEISTMRSPVTPMYSTNFGDYASLHVEHMGGPTGAPGLALFNTVAPPQHHSNSHYMEQNPFIVSPVTPLAVTAATAAAMKRNIEPSEYWSYNPVTEANSVRSYSPQPRSVPPPASLL